MSFTIGENYLLQALDYYPYNLELVCENLNYALSYDDENDGAWCLHGKVMAHHIKDLETAEESFSRALSLNLQNHEAMFELIWLMIEQEKFEKANKFIAQAKRIRGTDLATLYRIEAVIFERQGKLSKAKKRLDKAMDVTYNKGFESFLKGELKRIKSKRKRIDKRKKKSSKRNKASVAVQKKKKSFSLLRLFF